MRSMISIAAAGESAYRVTVQDGATRTVHDVTVTAAHIARYAPGTPAESLLRASFEFLLDREPQQAIMARFALPTIERYFPDYPLEIRELLQRQP